ncbi:hypothetical protein ACS0TY_027135 [Phlomoides rotata]
MGDFNMVLGAHERSRGARNPARPSQEFMPFLDEAHLDDMDTSGPQFTWVTRRSNHGYMAARLDRVLVNDEFMDIWQATLATVLPRISSDHHPILLRLHETLGHMIRPLRFQHMNIYVEMEEASESLTVIQAEVALYGDTEDRLLVEIDCTVRFNTILNQHLINSTQRNRFQWLQDGDRNSQFCPTMNKIHKTSVGLSSLVVDGELTFDPGIISDSVV